LKIIGIYGASGFGREVLEVLRRLTKFEDCKLYFIDDYSSNEILDGVPVVKFEKFVSLVASIKEIIVALGDSRIKKRIVDKIADSGLAVIGVSSPDAYIDTSSIIDATAIIMPGAIISANTCIKKHSLINFQALVAHDSVVGEFSILAPRVICNGNVNIGSMCSIGAGAIIHPGKYGRKLNISDGVKIGLGSVVLGSVRENVTMFGNPAKVLQQ
jgi:sugar O-acyltransferase (sialic acid O-acetyltransferase NeuD family)